MFKTVISKYLKGASFSNMLWLFGDHLVTFIGGLLISIWLARDLGPAYFGIYGFALALYSIFANFARAGLSGLSVKDQIESEDKQESISTIFLIKLGTSIIAILSLLLYVFYFVEGEEKVSITLIIALAILLTPFTVFDEFYDSIVKSRFRVIGRKIGYIVKSIGIVVFILLDWKFITLGWIVLLEQIVSVVILVPLFLKNNTFQWKFSMPKAKKLLNQSFPLIISGLGAVLYLKIDQIMVVSMVSDEAGGNYAAAVRYTSIFYFLHAISLTTFFPKLLTLKRDSSIQFQVSIVSLSASLLYMSLFIIIGTLLFIKPFINWTFGPQYFESIEIIKYHIWSLPLVFLGAVLSKWLIIENLTRYSLVRHSLGLTVNLVLNSILIPIYGAVGAAIASIAALFFAVIVILPMNDSLRLLGKYFVLGLLFPVTYLKKKINVREN